MSTCVLSSRFVDAEAVDADAVGSGCCSRRSSAASSSLAPVPVAARRERSTSLMGTCCIYSRKSGDFTNKTRNFVGIVADFCWRSWYILQFKPPFVWKSHSPKMPTVWNLLKGNQEIGIWLLMDGFGLSKIGMTPSGYLTHICIHIYIYI